jgi:catechol 2,3-dioxygenase-like lactoylglutathione lyase family enzyme
MLVALNHANISTVKLEETLAFFTEVLGLTVGPRPGFSFDGAWLWLNGHPVIHLVVRARAKDPDGAIDHVSFTVADFDAALARLDRLGVPYDASPIPDEFGRQAFLRDPNGVRIELTEIGPAVRAG